MEISVLANLSSQTHYSYEEGAEEGKAASFSESKQSWVKAGITLTDHYFSQHEIKIS